MSTVPLAWAAADVAVAAVACTALLRASSRPELFVRNGYRWLAAAVACLGVGAAAQQAFGGVIGGAQPLRVADLISLAALPALVIGIATLTDDLAADDGGRPPSGRLGRGAAAAPGGRRSSGLVPAWPVPGIVVDCSLLVASLFVICLVTVFGPDYAHGGVGPESLAVALIRPVADLIALGLLLRFAVRSPRLTALPALALVAIAVADCLAVGHRITDAPTGLASNVAVIIGLCLLAAAPRARLAVPAGSPPTAAALAPSRAERAAGSWSSPATLAALAAAAVAALVVTALAIIGRPVAAPALATSAAIVVLLLVLRLAGLARQASVVAAIAHESDRSFRVLAETTIDAVLVCDLSGVIEYASPATAEYGYEPGELLGTRLGDLVHPQDRPAGVRAAVAGLRAGPTAGSGGPGIGGSFSGRIRGADGSWRYVESSLSRYEQEGEPVRLLVTARDVSDRVALRRQVAHLTFHDGLTGLPNRAYLEERLRDLSQPSRDHGGPGPDAGVAAAILINLDGFAAVTDLLGSSGGDLVLAQAGRRLRTAAPHEATVARWGGDEFAVLMADAGSAEEVIDLGERFVVQIASQPFSVADQEVTLTASVGVALSAAAVSELLSSAHVAMTKALEAGGARVEVFQAAMYEPAQRRLELAADLRQAVADQRLDLEYQPVVELATMTVAGVEAVVRWRRADQLIGRQELLGVAEDTGLIGPIGDWMLRAACAEVAAWRAAGTKVDLSVSFSVRELTAPRFVDWMLAALDETGLDRSAFTLGITELALVDSAAPIVAELAALRQKGIRLAIDDFGSGRASLAHLRELAADIIKIDSPFIGGLDADPSVALLAKAIVQLGHDLGIEVIAQGIDRPEQLTQLKAMGCRFGQGAAVAAPIRAGGEMTGLPDDTAGSPPGDAAGDSPGDAVAGSANGALATLVRRDVHGLPLPLTLGTVPAAEPADR